MDVKVSVIVPIHNGGEYLKESMECIVSQTLREIEILCVDDGSTDDSVDIIEEFRKKDDRIQLYCNEKSNAGAARNYALDRAHGKYLLFWDSDDLFDVRAAEMLYQKMEADKADIGVCNADHYDTLEQIYIEKPQYLDKKKLPDEIPFSNMTNRRYIFNFTSQVAWNKMFRREFVEKNAIRFQEIPRINDHYFVSVSMALAECITIVDEVLVHYRVNQKNNLTNSSSDSPLCKYDVQCDLKRKLLELGLLKDDLIKQSFTNKALNTMLHGLNIQNNIEGFQILYNKLREEGLSYLELKDYGEDYYYNLLEYRNLKYIMDNSYEEYLLIKCIEYRDTISRKNDQIKKKEACLKDLRKEKKELQKKERELNYIKSTKRYKFMAKLTSLYHRVFSRGRKKV
ncbi:MAG: glycosyltransferase [Lachnospiraceae bacterium]|nr:glycosyltransferase [Lachnospiraceae bacterium]